MASEVDIESGLPSATAKPKRQLFNRPAWARGPVTNSKDAQPKSSGDVFNRSAQSFQEILAEKERKHQRKTEKAQLKADKEARRKSARLDRERERSREDEAGGSARKKRRITDEDYERYGIIRSPVVKKDSAARDDESRTDSSSPVKRPQRAPLTKITSQRAHAASEVIDLSDSDEDGGPPSPAPQPIPVQDQSEEEEEAFPELAAAARERQRKLMEEQKVTQQRHLETSTDPFSTQPDPAPPPDPVISLLVTSSIPNTEPLLVRRRFSQRLQEVREVWCGKQRLNPATCGIFLTYKLRRLYDVTTCKSLGIKCDSSGRLLVLDKYGDLTSEEDASRVVVEAMTEDIFEQRKKARDEERKRLENPDQYEEDGAATPNATGQKENSEPPAKEVLRILLKAKGYKDYRLKVKKVLIQSHA